MTPNDRRRADALDRYWDAVLRGDDPARPVAVSTEAAAIIARFGERRAPHELDPAQQRVRRRVVAAAGATVEIPLTTTILPPGRVPDPVAPHRPSARPATVRRRMGAQLATAALLLLTLGVGYLAFGPGRADNGRPTAVPTKVAPAAPSAVPSGVTEEMLVEVEIPAEVLPPGVAGAAFDHNTLRPGLRTTWTVRQDVHLRYVLDGTLTVRSASPLRVMRASSRAWEEVAPGTQVDLAPGDAVLVLGVATADFDNLGDTPVEIVGLILTAGNDSANPTPGQWVVGDYALSEAGGVALPGGPAVLRLRRFVLAPDASVPPPPAAIVRLDLSPPDNPAGTPEASLVMKQSDGSLRNFGGEAAVYVVSLEAAGGPPTSPAPVSPSP